MELTFRRNIAELEATYGAEALAHELALEERMVSMGRDQIRKQIERARQYGNESATGYGQNLIARSVERIGAAIDAFVEKASTGGAGRRHIAVKYLRQVDSEVAAFILMRCVVDSLTGKKQLLQRVAINVASRIEDEVRFARFQEAAKEADKGKLFNAGQRKAAKGTTYHRKKSTMAGYERRFDGDEWVAWPEPDKLHLGMKLVDLVIESGLVHVGVEVTSRRDTRKVLQPTAKIVEWIERESAKSELLTPAHLPMCVEPLPWTDPFNGGYLTSDAMGRNALVKTNNLNYLTEMADNADDMPAVYAAVNALQATRWRINARVHSTAQELWDEADTTLLPSREDIDCVPCPCCGEVIDLPTLNTRGSEDHDCFKDDETLRQWKKAAHETHEANVSLRSKRMSTAKTLRVAGIFADCEALFFPYQLDFRGRIYSIPSFNPQGADLTKALLHFADGMAIDDGVAAGWLAIQGANVWGFDKASLEDRIGWVEDHTDMICAVAKDPLDCREWMKADDPWQFLAFCFEWAGFVAEGYGFVSHLPVALDGSCSGIQHFSAMLRDPVGGKAVNLVPQETPADIYQTVCDKVVEKLKAEVGELSATIAQASPAIAKAEGIKASRGREEEDSYSKSNGKSYSQGWLDLKPNRKTTKRQVMTLPYGSTIFSCREYTQKWMVDQIDDGHARPWDKAEDFEASKHMSTLIWDSISETVTAAREAMDWLQSCAKVVAKEQLPVYWTTPSGFPVMQRYPNYAAKRVKTKLGDAVVKLTLQQEQATIDKRKMASAISPNFVHALDATHLVMSTEMAEANGVQHFAMIHDSFGTHAANTSKLAACLREAFVELYHETDVLEDFRQQIIRQVDPESIDLIKPVPAKGDLDVTCVRESDFFFA